MDVEPMLCSCSDQGCTNVVVPAPELGQTIESYFQDGMRDLDEQMSDLNNPKKALIKQVFKAAKTAYNYYYHILLEQRSNGCPECSFEHLKYARSHFVGTLQQFDNGELIFKQALEETIYLYTELENTGLRYSDQIEAMELEIEQQTSS